MKRNILSILFAASVILSFAQTERRMTPDFTAITMEQDTVNLFNLIYDQEKYVVLEFFFSDNILCQETSPYVSEASQRMGNNEEDVVFLSINIGDSNRVVQNYIDFLSLSNVFISGVEGNGTPIAADTFAIQSYPTIIMIGPDTLIAYDTLSAVDTTLNGIDTTLYELEAYNYNIYENDIWPVYAADDIIDVLKTYGLTESMSVFDPIEKREDAFFVYPNPNQGRFHIRSQNLQGDFDYQLIGLSGRILKQGHIKLQQGEDIDLHIEGLKSGLYFLKMADGQAIYSQKLMIQ